MASKAEKKRSGEISKQKLLEMSEISLWLDTYDDIFSDFDPRPYTERALSTDFLSEAKRASREASGAIELKLLVPKNKRNHAHEALIQKRLREHFTKHQARFREELFAHKKQSFWFIGVGILLEIFTAFILYEAKDKSWITTFLILLFEPAAWYFFWEGLNVYFFESKKVRPDLDFYNKMSRCRVKFFSI